jgi:hypothetical protein
MRCMSGLSRTSPLKSVAIAPGATVLAVIRRGASSLARLRVNLHHGVGGRPRKREVCKPARQIDDAAAVCDQRQRRVDLIQEGFDCVLRVGPLVDTRSSSLARSAC